MERMLQPTRKAIERTFEVDRSVRLTDSDTSFGAILRPALRANRVNLSWKQRESSAFVQWGFCCYERHFSSRIAQMMEKMTPLRSQYLRIKRKYPEAIVFFRLGDFYETFDKDAEVTSREL